jgi:hypothetical protein
MLTPEYGCTAVRPYRFYIYYGLRAVSRIDISSKLLYDCSSDIFKEMP